MMREPIDEEAGHGFNQMMHCHDRAKITRHLDRCGEVLQSLTRVPDKTLRRTAVSATIGIGSRRKAQLDCDSCIDSLPRACILGVSYIERLIRFGAPVTREWAPTSERGTDVRRSYWRLVGERR